MFLLIDSSLVLEPRDSRILLI